MSQPSPFGVLLRTWRERRRVSQLDLALGTDVSARHVSFVETGRAVPSREMVLRLAEHLDVPLRDRNALLQAAGHAPEYARRELADPQMAVVRSAVERILEGYRPFPAVAVDRSWTLVAANPPLAALITGVAAHLLEPPVNVLRLSLHPDGLAPAIGNLDRWRGTVLGRLEREVAVTADPGLARLRDELDAYPGGRTLETGPGLAVPLVLDVGGAELAFLSTVTTFGTARDLTLAELSVEAFLPADDATAAFLQRAAVRS